MMSKLIFVEQVHIGGIDFRGYIISKNEVQAAYAIFINNFDEPFLEMVSDLESKKVEFDFNPIMIEYLLEHRPTDKKLRELQFKVFYEFIIESERKASYMIFKNEKLDYLRKNKVVVQLRRLYINLP